MGNNKEEKIERLIEKYFNITGRPVSTLTVDEFLKFTSISDNISMTTLQNDVIKAGPETQTAIQAGFDMDKENWQNITETDKKINQKTNSSQILAMLQSVSG